MSAPIESGDPKNTPKNMRKLHESSALKTRVSVNGLEEGVQKIVIDVKNDTVSQKVTNDKSQSSSRTNNKRGNSNSTNQDKRVTMKREISLVLEPTPKKCNGYVGFANLPNQVYR